MLKRQKSERPALGTRQRAKEGEVGREEGEEMEGGRKGRMGNGIRDELQEMKTEREGRTRAVATSARFNQTLTSPFISVALVSMYKE